MIKRNIKPFAILIVMLSCALHITRGIEASQYWGVSVTDEFVYDINNITIDYQTETDTYNNTAIPFDTGMLPEESSLTVEINAINNDSVNYLLSYTSLSESHQKQLNNFEDELLSLMLLPQKIASQEITQEEIIRGFTGIDYLLVPNWNTTWDIFAQYDNPFYLITIEEMISSNADADVQAEVNKKSQQDYLVFDWFINATQIDSETETDLTMIYYLKMAYQLSTGLLLGMRMDLQAEGTNNGEMVQLAIESEVEKEGYNLADFVLPGEDINLHDLLSQFLPAFSWPLTIITIVAFAIMSYKIRRSNKS